ncbi:hypothetical protein MKEN_00641800 [Mycena kentingensis (nom. inval.)]|nr:hypothetical protein MKEN_00641800 [Mycena kentingensis (nom. inval.)]
MSTPSTRALVRTVPPSQLQIARCPTTAVPPTAVGRLLFDTYESLGRLAASRVNRLGYKLGFGPLATLKRIQEEMGDGAAREAQTRVLLEKTPARRLQKRCHALMRYTLCSESATSQQDAFRCLVSLCTMYPGMRRVFLSSPMAQDRKSVQELVVDWSRGDKLEQTELHRFHAEFAAEALLENDLSRIVETPALLDLTAETSGLCAIEQLLIASACGGQSSFAASLAVRYLGGILELPSFWSKSQSARWTEILSKLVRRLTEILEEFGLELACPPHRLHDFATRGVTCDAEGVDVFAAAMLRGVYDAREFIAESRHKGYSAGSMGTGDW